MSGFAGRRADEIRRLARAVAGAPRRCRDLLARGMDLLGRRGQRLHVLHRLIGGAGDGPQGAIDRDHQGELRREQLEQVTVRLAIHGGVGMPHTPQADELPRMV